MNQRRVVTLAAIAILVFAISFSLRVAWEYTPSAAAQGEPDCQDYESQADLRDNPTDPFGRDGPPGPTFAGKQGVACEDYSYPPGSPRDETPVNVESTGGSTTPTPPPPSPPPQPTPPPPPMPNPPPPSIPNLPPQPPPSPIFNSGGPEDDPVPVMLSGKCAKEFPVKQGDACYASG